MKRMRKSKHNKKRNTAFLYEVLIQDITRSVVNGDQKRKEVALHICKEFFNRGSVLYNEKELYMTLVDSHDIDSPLLEKLLEEAKKEYAKLDRKEIFNMQTRMIMEISINLSQTMTTTQTSIKDQTGPN